MCGFVSRHVAATEPVARFDHTCRSCGGTIRKGEKHRKEVLVVDGEILSWREHSDYDVCLANIAA